MTDPPRPPLGKKMWKPSENTAVKKTGTEKKWRMYQKKSPWPKKWKEYPTWARTTGVRPRIGTRRCAELIIPVCSVSQIGLREKSMKSLTGKPTTSRQLNAEMLTEREALVSANGFSAQHHQQRGELNIHTVISVEYMCAQPEPMPETAHGVSEGW